MFLAPLGFLKAFWDLLKSIPWRAWVGFAAFLIGVILVFSYGNYRENQGASRVQGLWDAATTQAQEEARATERGWREGISKYATDETNKRLAREREFASILDGLQSGNGPVRVRPRLKCSVPKLAGAAAGNDDSAAQPGQSGGFQESDAVVVLRIGEDADSVASRLAQCQHYVKTVSGG